MVASTTTHPPPSMLARGWVRRHSVRTVRTLRVLDLPRSWPPQAVVIQPPLLRPNEDLKAAAANIEIDMRVKHSAGSRH
eukprot:6268833-Pyramimonas_sp.AAC.1